MLRILSRFASAARFTHTVPLRSPITKFDPEGHFAEKHRREVNLVLWKMEVDLLKHPEQKWGIMGSAIDRISVLAKREVRRLQEEGNI